VRVQVHPTTQFAAGATDSEYISFHVFFFFAGVDQFASYLTLFRVVGLALDAYGQFLVDQSTKKAAGTRETSKFQDLQIYYGDSAA
jgi:hypothetical protein